MLEAGKLLQDRYSIEKQIGQGGMGAVYVAKDERFRSVVAIKEMLFAEENYRKAFDREARLLNSLRHPALPNVSDYFAEGNGQFLVMEYIAGEDLYETLVRTGKPFPLENVLIWANQLLDALDYLHNQNTPVIHRDIKPQNLKLTPDNQIILLDFGLAKGNPADITNHTATKSIFGYSPGYASLEQIQGTGTEPRSDLYSLAATLYHLMTGIPPTDALTRAMSVLNAKPDPLQPAHLVHREIPTGVSEILRQSMALNASQRPVSAIEMRAMFDNKDKITISEAETPFTEFSLPADIHSRKTEIIPGTTPANRQSDLKTKVLENAASEQELSKITKIASKSKGKTDDGKFKNRYAIAASVFGILLLLGIGIYGLYVFQPADAQNPLVPFDSNIKKQLTVIEKNKTDPNDQTTEDNSISPNQPENPVETIAENPVQPETKKKVETIVKPGQPDKTSTPPKNASKNTVVKNEGVDNNEEINVGNIRVKGDRVETDEFIVEGENIILKKPSHPGVRNNQLPLSPEQMRRLTPEQRKKLRKAFELQRRMTVKPPIPPEPDN